MGAKIDEGDWWYNGFASNVKDIFLTFFYTRQKKWNHEKVMIYF